ncbi:MAG TPA: indolepyruvate oxidoreductase subunit beta family protein [Xanthobacteraceae bacterium]|nr:indolepyruvate oxidoreductase subunit beta family protein [Xanthobacteraceae bacterium]
MSDTRPFTLLIAALGGEGGGVLTDWIVSAAEASGLPVQSTSIPGVAQRTGATTYYVEIFPVPLAELGGRRPVLALAPGVGDVDLVVASELLEAGRAIANGFVTADRTLLIASVSRVYLTTEKMQMADGRYDSERLLKAAEQNAKERILFDMAAAAKETGAIVNAVMLGAIAGSGRMPLPLEAFEAAIKHDGKAVDANLRGFRAGLAAAREQLPAMLPRSGKRAAKPTLGALEAEASTLPEPARAIVIEGIRRLVAYQGADYARLYLDRLKPFTDPGLLAETARHLAVRMSFEDVIRVAEAKISPERFRRIEGEIGAKDQPYVITEFLKPGIEELCQVLPPRLARAIVAYSDKRGWLGTVWLPMELKTTSVFGYLRFWALAKLKRFRPKSWRYAEEQFAIEAWLKRVTAAAKLSPELALEVAECARLIKGYGDTWKRGAGNYALIEARVIVPVLEGRIPVRAGIDAVASARTAALLDPEGEGLTKALAAIDAQASLPLAAE